MLVENIYVINPYNRLSQTVKYLQGATACHMARSDTLKDVSHTNPNGESVAAVWERGPTDD